MMSGAPKKVIDTIAVASDRPTELTFDQLYTWVIWQFPRRKGPGLCGAVRPPLEAHSWLPAIVQPQKRLALVHAHLDEEFESPESAAEWLDRADG
jgi:hypothetical protein